MAQEEGLVVEHLFAGNEGFFELGKEVGLLGGPLFEAAASEFAFFMANKKEAVVFGDVFAPVDVVEFEGAAFDVVFDVAPEDLLDADPVVREKAEGEFLVDVFGDDLGGFVGFEDDGFAVFEDGNLVVAFAGEFPDEGTIAVGNVYDLKFFAGVFEDAPLDNAKWTIRNLNQLDHSSAQLRTGTGRASK